MWQINNICKRMLILERNWLYQYNASYIEHDESFPREILLKIFRLVTLNDVSVSFKINDKFVHNDIAIYDFTVWFCSSFSVSDDVKRLVSKKNNTNT